MGRKTKLQLLTELQAANRENARLQEALAAARKPVIEGRIEAFDFAAAQFETYADDNDTLHRRYGTNKKLDLAVAAKRSETFRSCADELRGYAAKQREDLACD